MDKDTKTLIVCVVLFAVSVLVLRWDMKRQKAKQEQQRKAMEQAREYRTAEAAKRAAARTIEDWIYSPDAIPARIIKGLEYARVDLVPEPDNQHDPDAIAVIYYDDDKAEEIRLGYLFKGKFRDEIREALEHGHRVKAGISSADPDDAAEDPRRWIEIFVEIYE